MQPLIFIVLLVAPVFAIPHYEHHEPKYATVPVVHNKVVGYTHHTPLHTVQKVHHTVHPISIPQHHPPVTTVHHEPTSVLAKAPKISGFAFKSEVRHDAHLAHASSYGHGDHGHGGYGHLDGAASHGHAVIAHGGYHGGDHGYHGSHGYHHEPAPYVSSAHLSVSPAKIIEKPAVSSYTQEIGRIDTHTKEHYNTVHIPVTHKVGYKTIAVHESHHGGHGGHLGYGSHY